MKIGLIDVDSHNFPNLCLMKISAYHKSRGDTVEFVLPCDEYDIIYQSKTFDNTYTDDIDWIPRAKKIIKGGLGYGKHIKLPYEIEHIYPDYSLYPKYTKDTAYGYLTRGCPNIKHKYCVIPVEEGLCSHKVADLNEFWRDQKNIVLLDPNILACKDHIYLLEQIALSKAYIDFNQGLDIRLTTDANIEIINRIKVNNIHFAWDDAKEEILQHFKYYKLYAKHKPNGAYGTVYCLVNYNTTMEENLYRIYKLREMGYDPYVMIYNKPFASKEIKRLQRWCNNRKIFKTTKKFEEYLG